MALDTSIPVSGITYNGQAFQLAGGGGDITPWKIAKGSFTLAADTKTMTFDTGISEITAANVLTCECLRRDWAEVAPVETYAIPISFIYTNYQGHPPYSTSGYSSANKLNPDGAHSYYSSGVSVTFSNGVITCATTRTELTSFPSGTVMDFVILYYGGYDND